MVAVTAIAVVLFATPLAIALGRLHREEEVVRLERTAAEASEDVPANFPKTNEPIGVRAVHGHVIGLYGRDGKLVTGGGPKVADAITRLALRGSVHDRKGGSQILVAIPLTRGDHVVGALRASVSDSAVNERTRNDILVMVGIGALAVGVSALIGLRQSWRLAQPVDRLSHAAVRLGDGDFTIRAEVSGVPEVDAVSAALETTASRLDQMLSRERAFSEDASHQLRTPLTGLRLTLEAARLDPTREPDTAFAAALEEVDRLERTIDDLLALARGAPTQHADTDLVVVLRGLDEAWRSRIERVGRDLRIGPADRVPHVAVSDRAIRQILDVLLDNALRHGAGEIAVRVRAAGAGAAIEVTDAGRGVVGDAKRIFDRRASSVGSHGIGLALARALAEAEGARLSLAQAGPEPVFTLVMSPGRLENLD